MAAQPSPMARLAACRAHLRSGLRGVRLMASSSGSEANPLLLHQEMPRFRQITAAHVEPAITELLERQEADISALEAKVEALGDAVTYADVMIPMEQLLAPLSYAFGLVGHLLSVQNSEEMREAHQAVQPAVVASGSRIAQSEPLYRAMKAVASGAEVLDSGQLRAVEAGVRDAELGGVALEGEAKERFNAIKQRLAELSTAFSNNVLDATAAWDMAITDKAQLAGLPPSALALAAQNAGEDATAEEGPWRLTLDMPVMLPVMQFADSRELRETVYKVRSTTVPAVSVSPRWFAFLTPRAAVAAGQPDQGEQRRARQPAADRGDSPAAGGDGRAAGLRLVRLRLDEREDGADDRVGHEADGGAAGQGAARGRRRAGDTPRFRTPRNPRFPCRASHHCWASNSCWQMAPCLSG